MNLKSIRHIYEKLQDDESKKIFSRRLLWSLTGDDKYLWKIIQDMEPVQWLKEQVQKGESYLFGAGVHGKEVLRLVPNGWSGILDNDVKKWGTKLGEVKIVPPQTICSHPNARVFVAVRKIGTNYTEEVLQQLNELDVSADRIVRLEEKIFDWAYTHQYFDLPALQHVENETFIDGGAFDGETAKAFARWAGNFHKIYMFEPDQENRVKCKQAQRELGDEKGILLPYGLWSEKDELKFNSNRDSSNFSLDGNISVPVTSIDQELPDEHITFIKLDVEGSELEALRGAKQCIQNQHPKLAICVYHKKEDVVTIPEYILSICDDYQLYLRHYYFGQTETVLYAL